MTRAIAPSTLSAPAWRRLRTSLTAALFVVATTGGIALAVQAPAVSPVAPAVTVAAAPLPAPSTVDAPRAAAGNPGGHAGPGGPGEHRGAGAHGGGPR